MNLMHTFFTIKILVLNEVRLRMRRLSTLIALFLMIALSWAIIVDPSSGLSMMVVNDARVSYTSSALAFGSASLVGLLLGLIGFYLARGRMAEDMRNGVGQIIATTQVRNSLFIFSRWLGGVAYLSLLVAAFAAAIMVLQVLRGIGPIEIMVYLQTFMLISLPMIFFSVAMAIFFDSVPLLMGKFGDVMYFVVWVMQMGILPILDRHSTGQLSPWLLFDFGGISMTMIAFKSVVASNNFSIGATPFNPALPAITLPVAMWSVKMVYLRIAASSIALLPLLPAIFLFHRFSPDRVKLSAVKKRRSPLMIINQWMRPLAKQAHALFRLASRLPSMAGQVVAEVALTLVNAPFSILVLIVVLFMSALMPLKNLPQLLTIVVTFWGIFISDMSTRDYQAGLESMTNSITGGAMQRYLRQFFAAFLLGLMLVGVIALRWSFTAPMLTLALLTGLMSMSALATLLGRCSRTPRTFMAIFMLWVYVATQVPQVALVDALGFNGVANSESILMQFEIAMASLLIGVVLNKWLTYR